MQRLMKELICPKCGNTTHNLYENVCKNCFFKQFKLAELDPVISTQICARCGSKYERGQWTDTKHDTNTVLEKVESELLLHENADIIELGFEPQKLTPYQYIVNIYIQAEIYGMPLEEKLTTEVRVQRSVCDACSRIAAGYYEGIIQLRASNRNPTDEEKKKCDHLVRDTLSRMEKKGDRLAFISNMSSSKEGTDYYIGSSGACRQICKIITSKLGGEHQESPSLFSQRDGKELYRVSYAVRLPKYVPGNILYFNNQVLQIKNCDKKAKCIDLQTGKKVIASIEDIEKAEFLGVYNDSILAVLVAIEDNAIMVLDPTNYQTVTLKKPFFLTAREGEEIPVLKTEYGIIPIPEEIEA